MTESEEIEMRDHSDLLSNLPSDMQILILSMLDFISLARASQVSKKWNKILSAESLWQSIYEDKDNQAYLCNGELYKYFYREASKINPNVNELLLIYFNQGLQINLCLNSIENFLREAETNFLVGYPIFRHSAPFNENDLFAFSEYLRPLTVYKNN